MGHSFDPQLIFAKALMANLATASSDGPRNSPVWFLWEDDRLWMPGSVGSSFVQRIELDPRVAVEIVDFDSAEGRLAHLGLRGEAGIAPMTSDRFRRLIAKYLGDDENDWNQWFVDNIVRLDDPDGRWVTLIPDTVFTNNVSYFRTGPRLAWPVPE